MSAMRLSSVWALICLVLVVTGGMLHHNTIRGMTKDTEHWLSLAAKTLDAAHENEQVLSATIVTQDKLIADMSKDLDGYDELCEVSYEQICEIRRRCEDVLARVDVELYNTVELLLAEAFRLERALFHTVMIDAPHQRTLKHPGVMISILIQKYLWRLNYEIYCWNAFDCNRCDSSCCYIP